MPAVYNAQIHTDILRVITTVKRCSKLYDVKIEEIREELQVVNLNNRKKIINEDGKNT